MSYLAEIQAKTSMLSVLRSAGLRWLMRVMLNQEVCCLMPGNNVPSDQQDELYLLTYMQTKKRGAKDETPVNPRNIKIANEIVEEAKRKKK
jgi:hypothetical protein